MKFIIHIPSTWVDDKQVLGDLIAGAIGDEIQHSLEGTPEDVGLTGEVPSTFYIWERAERAYVFAAKGRA